MHGILQPAAGTAKISHNLSPAVETGPAVFAYLLSVWWPGVATRMRPSGRGGLGPVWRHGVRVCKQALRAAVSGCHAAPIALLTVSAVRQQHRRVLAGNRNSRLGVGVVVPDPMPVFEKPPGLGEGCRGNAGHLTPQMRDG